MKKFFLTLFFTICLGFIAMKFGTQAFVWSDPGVVPEETQPIHFKLNPVLWLPSYFIFKNDITDLTIVKSLLWAIPYWIFISYLLSTLMLNFFAKKSSPLLD